MIKDLPRKEEESIDSAGLHIPKQSLDDEQVAQGVIVRVDIVGYEKGDVVLFHKVMPVDVNLKIDDDIEFQKYYFIKEQDVICKIV